MSAETPMPVVLERYDNRERFGDTESVEAILLIDSAVVGTIGPSRQAFRAETKGLLPAIDGLTGASIDAVWSQIEALVGARQVQLIRQVAAVRYVARDSAPLG